MSNMVPWDPFREFVSLRDAMDRLFETALVAPRGGGATQQSGAGWMLPLDVTENEDNYVVKAAIPGVNPDDLDISVTENVLTIKGEMKSEDTDDKNTRYHLRERRWGSFSRSIELPTAVDTDNVQAECTNGLLTLTLPKAEEVRPKRIQIKGATQQKVLDGHATQK